MILVLVACMGKKVEQVENVELVNIFDDKIFRELEISGATNYSYFGEAILLPQNNIIDRDSKSVVEPFLLKWEDPENQMAEKIWLKPFNLIEWQKTPVDRGAVEEGQSLVYEGFEAIVAQNGNGSEVLLWALSEWRIEDEKGAFVSMVTCVHDGQIDPLQRSGEIRAPRYCGRVGVIAVEGNTVPPENLASESMLWIDDVVYVFPELWSGKDIYSGDGNIYAWCLMEEDGKLLIDNKCLKLPNIQWRITDATQCGDKMIFSNYMYKGDANKNSPDYLAGKGIDDRDSLFRLINISISKNKDLYYDVGNFIKTNSNYEGLFCSGYNDIVMLADEHYDVHGFDILNLDYL